jgi:hypothetical protein
MAHILLMEVAETDPLGLVHQIVEAVARSR